MKKVLLVTDGSCLGNPGPGGWAALLRYDAKEKLISGAEPDTTNNRMEITAVLRGLEALNESCEVLIKTDSRYVIDAFDKGWLVNWKANNWRTAAKKPVKNQDLWQLLEPQLQKHQFSWEWVKGHSGDADNERVDDAAREAAMTL